MKARMRFIIHDENGSRFVDVKMDTQVCDDWIRFYTVEGARDSNPESFLEPMCAAIDCEDGDTDCVFAKEFGRECIDVLPGRRDALAARWRIHMAKEKLEKTDVREIKKFRRWLTSARERGEAIGRKKR